MNKTYKSLIIVRIEPPKASHDVTVNGFHYYLYYNSSFPFSILFMHY